MISLTYNGTEIQQREKDAYVNATQMCKANGKLIGDWVRTEDYNRYTQALSTSMGIPIDQLVVMVKTGKNENRGTWIHPKLAIKLGRWISVEFELWCDEHIQTLITTGKTELRQGDLQRVESRDTLKDEARLDLTDQVKVYLDIMKEKYDDPKKQAFFYARIHDALNVALTTETSRKMKDRILAQFDVKEKDIDLIRDYFPNALLIRYVSVCRVWASLISRYPDKSPLDYLNEAITLATGKGFKPTPIDFTESIKFVRHRLKESNSQNLLT